MKEKFYGPAEEFSKLPAFILQKKSEWSEVHSDVWLPDQDSNPNKMSQSHLCYPYTIRQYKWCEQWDLNPHAISTRPSNVPVCRFQHARMLGHESGCQHHRRLI